MGVMLNLVVAVLMKELTDAEAEDKLLQEEIKAKEEAEAVAMEIDGTDNGRKSRRKSFAEMMKDGASYWSRRLSNAHQPNNVMYDFPEKEEDDGTLKNTNDVKPDESSAVKELKPLQPAEGVDLPSGEVSPSSPAESVGDVKGDGTGTQ